MLAQASKELALMPEFVPTPQGMGTTSQCAAEDRKLKGSPGFHQTQTPGALHGFLIELTDLEGNHCVERDQEGRLQGRCYECCRGLAVSLFPWPRTCLELNLPLRVGG